MYHCGHRLPIIDSHSFLYQFLRNIMGQEHKFNSPTLQLMIMSLNNPRLILLASLRRAQFMNLSYRWVFVVITLCYDIDKLYIIDILWSYYIMLKKIKIICIISIYDLHSVFVYYCILICNIFLKFLNWRDHEYRVNGKWTGNMENES